MKTVVLANSFLALPCLEELRKRGELHLVITPDQVHEGTRRVLDFVQHNNIRHQQVTKEDLDDALPLILEEDKVDLCLSVTFPYKFPQALLNAPALGCFNFHFGLLPGYRGAEPIFWQIRRGEKQGGITLHKMDAGIDTGPIYHQGKLDIAPDDTHGLHMVKLAFLSPKVMQDAWQMITDPSQQGHPQPVKDGNYFRKPVAEDLLIDWHQPAQDIINLIRECNPWNRGAIAYLEGMEVRVSQGYMTRISKEVSAGTIISANEMEGLIVACGGNTAIRLDILCMDEGIMTGATLCRLGVNAGLRFPSPLTSSVD